MILSLHDLSVGYGHRRVVHNVSLQIATGDVVCLLGPNGSGKTTLFKAMLGLLPLQSGEMKLDGTHLRQWSRRNYCATYCLCATTPCAVVSVHGIGYGEHGTHALPSRMFRPRCSGSPHCQ